MSVHRSTARGSRDSAGATPSRGIRPKRGPGPPPDCPCRWGSAQRRGCVASSPSRSGCTRPGSNGKDQPPTDSIPASCPRRTNLAPRLQGLAWCCTAALASAMGTSRSGPPFDRRGKCVVGLHSCNMRRAPSDWQPAPAAARGVRTAAAGDSPVARTPPAPPVRKATICAKATPATSAWTSLPCSRRRRATVGRTPAVLRTTRAYSSAGCHSP
mmetsp:Transcript_67419/g.188121  ORF Transcript_67419/g.188121 Transcript_67419/m.188121 type:complete len:213 (+) Transcript_67419:403-1041(+)